LNLQELLTPTPSDVRLTSWKVALYKLHLMCTKHVFQGYSGCGIRKLKYTHNRHTTTDFKIVRDIYSIPSNYHPRYLGCF
jgi:hypothetical protein